MQRLGAPTEILDFIDTFPYDKILLVVIFAILIIIVLYKYLKYEMERKSKKMSK